MPEMSCKHANQFFTQKTNEIACKNIINHLAFPKSQRGFTHKTTLCCTLCKTRGEDFDVCNKDLIRPRCLLACAHCIHFACWDYRHIYLHSEDHPDHYLSVCTERGELFCTGCGDFVYHSVAETFHQSACRTYLAQFGLSNRYWRPSFNELRLIPHITPVLPLTVNGYSGVMRGGSALAQGSVFGVAAILPSKHMKAALEGQAVSGIIASLANIISIATSSSVTTNGLVYFLVALVFITATAAMFLVLPKIGYFKYYWDKKDLPDNNNIESDPSLKEVKDDNNESQELVISINKSGILSAMKETFLPGICVLITLMITLSIFPAVARLIRPITVIPQDLWTMYN
ncbi:unnamed protein product [Schistosoma rodhaini]|nr:unnamed protein product [Schistosoma rodhaini]